MTAPDWIPPHGTRARYNSRVAGCRCSNCREANTRYMAIYREKGPATRRRTRWRQLTIESELSR